MIVYLFFWILVDKNVFQQSLQKECPHFIKVLLSSGIKYSLQIWHYIFDSEFIEIFSFFDFKSIELSNIFELIFILSLLLSSIIWLLFEGIKPKCLIIGSPHK